MKRLFVLDLDNTLIYGTSYQNQSANILYKFSDQLIVYERPFAKEFVSQCRQKGDIIVYSTAVYEYAKKACDYLGINYIELFSREDCLIQEGRYVKSVPDYYFEVYDSVVIIDDDPDIWDQKTHEKCRIIRVPEFTGEADDKGMKINELQKIF